MGVNKAMTGTREVIRTLVVNTMRGDDLTPEAWREAYLMADGFGTVDLKFAEEQCWDWSHVRDSSPDAFKRMAEFIMAGLGTPVTVVYTD